MSVKRIEQIEHELERLARERGLRWQRIARLLLEVDRDELWRHGDGAESFSSWIRARAEALGLQERQLWRYLSAGRTYEELRESHPGAASLGEAPGVAAVTLECLARLQTCAPRDVVKTMTAAALAGRLPQSEARRAWRSYRGARSGSAQGRGTPEFKVDDSLVARAQVLERLRGARASWLPKKGAGDLEGELYIDVAVPEMDLVAAAVLVTRATGGAGPVLHEIEVALEAEDVEPAAARARELGSHGDYSWLAVGRQDSKLWDTVPASVGVVELGKDLEVRRKARRTISSTHRLADAVLMRLHGWHD